MEGELVSVPGNTTPRARGEMPYTLSTLGTVRHDKECEYDTREDGHCNPRTDYGCHGANKPTLTGGSS
ncbi:hypothetical protein J6590_080958 [Homalodisca vitripennis]|nr:hypothetical protein J6590_080958 [Homalodisca vitripennis]